jgi:hypothetical protein
VSYSIGLSEDGSYLICRVTGPMTVETAREFTQKMDRVSRETGVNRFLSDVREAPNVSGTLENYRYAYKDMPELDLRRDVRAAILADPADHSHDFAETVVQNAGYNVRLFHDEEAAIAWLLTDLQA